MSSYTLNLTPELYEYLLSVSLREHPVLEHLRETTAKLPSHNMQISPEQGQFMALLIQLMGARKTLEVGVYTGYSALVVALALPADGKIVACDINEEWTQIARDYWEQANVRNKIDLHLAPALETLDQLIAQGESNSFDFAFIDADKRNYLNYYERALTLLKPGGLIAIDNVLWGGDVINPHDQEKDTLAIRALNKYLHEDSRVAISLVPIADGLTLARKKS